MRKIKFRAWDKCNKKMYSYEDIEWWPIRTLNSDADVYEFIQYTGLKDKNGKEIYESDIVIYLRIETGELMRSIHEVYYDDEMLEFGMRNNNGLFHCQFSDEFKIIGNIHENSELLDS